MNAPRPPLAVPGLLGLASLQVLLHLPVLTRYGWFRDELYYMASARHLDWGYVDHPPLSLAVLALARALFGESLVPMRLVAALAGAGVVVLTGALAREVGGGRFAQCLAALCAVLAPACLGGGHFYSMNAFEMIFWPLATLLLLGALAERAIHGWAALGLVLGPRSPQQDQRPVAGRRDGGGHRRHAPAKRSPNSRPVAGGRAGRAGVRATPAVVGAPRMADARVHGQRHAAQDGEHDPAGVPRRPASFDGPWERPRLNHRPARGDGRVGRALAVARLDVPDRAGDPPGPVERARLLSRPRASPASGCGRHHTSPALSTAGAAHGLGVADGGAGRGALSPSPP